MKHCAREGKNPHMHLHHQSSIEKRNKNICNQSLKTKRSRHHHQSIFIINLIVKKIYKWKQNRFSISSIYITVHRSGDKNPETCLSDTKSTLKPRNPKPNQNGNQKPKMESKSKLRNPKRNLNRSPKTQIEIHKPKMKSKNLSQACI